MSTWQRTFSLLVVLVLGEAAVAAEIRGPIVKIDLDKKELVVDGRLRARGTSMTFVIDKDTQILFGQQAGTLADLSPGKRVRVVYELRDGKQVAQTIHAFGSKGDSATRPPDNATTGVLQRIVARDREIVIVSKAGQGGAETETTFALPEGITITRGGKAIQIEELKEGERVAVQVEKKDGKSLVVSVQVLAQEENRITKIRNILKTLDGFLEMMEQRRGDKP